MTGERVYWSLWLAAAALLVIELLIDKSGKVELEGLFAFAGIYGVVAALALTGVAALWRVLVERDEDYYDR